MHNIMIVFVRTYIYRNEGDLLRSMLVIGAVLLACIAPRREGVVGRAPALGAEIDTGNEELK